MRGFYLTIAPCHGLLAVGAFQAAEPSMEPTPPPFRFTYHVVLPASVSAGAKLRYTVTFSDAGRLLAVFGDQCPVYREDLYAGSDATGMPLGKHIYMLNCHAVHAIPPQASVTFAMVLDVPATATPGDYTLLWASEESTDTQDFQRLPVTITR